MVKRKAAVSQVQVCEGDHDGNSVVSSAVSSPMPTDDEITIKEERKILFKDPQFQHTSKTHNKKKAWRSLKQIITQERALPWPEEHPLYSSINAPPSFKPAKKYSDISGLIAKYTDPQTKLFYALSDEFSTVRSLPSDIIAGYLSLRGANNPIG